MPFAQTERGRGQIVPFAQTERGRGQTVPFAQTERERGQAVLLAQTESPLPEGEGQGGGETMADIRKARELRRNQTPEEALVWSALRRGQLDGFHFRRQYPKGAYIFDFVCLTARLAIEIDGPSHDQTVAYDAERSGYIERQGFRVIRFSNEDVRGNLGGVIETIRRALKSKPEER